MLVVDISAPIESHSYHKILVNHQDYTNVLFDVPVVNYDTPIVHRSQNSVQA